MIIIHFWTQRQEIWQVIIIKELPIYNQNLHQNVILPAKSDSVMNWSHNNSCKQHIFSAEMNIPRRNFWLLFEWCSFFWFIKVKSLWEKVQAPSNWRKSCYNFVNNLDVFSFCGNSNACIWCSSWVIVCKHKHKIKYSFAHLKPHHCYVWTDCTTVRTTCTNMWWCRSECCTQLLLDDEESDAVSHTKSVGVTTCCCFQLFWVFFFG